MVSKAKLHRVTDHECIWYFYNSDVSKLISDQRETDPSMYQTTNLKMDQGPGLRAYPSIRISRVTLCWVTCGLFVFTLVHVAGIPKTMTQNSYQREARLLPMAADCSLLTRWRRLARLSCRGRPTTRHHCDRCMETRSEPPQLEKRFSQFGSTSPEVQK